MNMDLIVIVIIFYILKNNNYKYCYAENRNQKLLLFLLFINEMDQYLNNKYIYMNLTNNKNGYWMNYPNHASNNSNNISNTNNINSKNNNDENRIKSEKDITINNDKYDVLKENTDNPISKDNDSFIDTNKKNIINNYNEDILINNDDETSINSNKHTIIDNNKETTINMNNVINNDNEDVLINNYNKIPINSSKHTIIDSNKETIISVNNVINNDNEDLLINNDNEISINSSEHTIIDSNKETTISVNNDINNDKNSPTDKNKDNIVNTDITTKNNKDKSMISSKNYTSNNLKSKSVKPATKAPSESSIYTASCQNTNSIPSNSISNTFKQLPLAKTITALNEFTKRFNLTAPTPLTDAKVKVPVLVGSTNITELFHGRVTFSKPIISILKVTNEIFITSKSILPNIHTNANNAELHYEGFLKTQLEYLEDIIIEKYQIKCDSKHYIMLIPFSGTKNLNLTDEIINSPDVILKDLTLDINKSTFFVNTSLEEPTKGNNYVNLYKTCNLTVKAECDISLYRKKLVDL